MFVSSFAILHQKRAGRERTLHFHTPKRLPLSPCHILVYLPSHFNSYSTLSNGAELAGSELIEDTDIHRAYIKLSP